MVLGRSFYGRDSLVVAPALLNKVLVRRLADGSRLAGRIVEVEAYRGADDPASHAYRGPTARNATMFGDPGHLYVYFTYGMHYCANVVCRPGRPGSPGAVLLRALAPLEGLEAMRRLRLAARRGARSGDGTATLRDAELCSGPAKLCEALGIDRSLDGADLVSTADDEAERRADGAARGAGREPDRAGRAWVEDGAARGPGCEAPGRVPPAIWLVDDGVPAPARPVTGPRIGLGAATGEAAGWPWRFAVSGDPNLSRPIGRRVPARAVGGPE